jgi:uncharacterized protein (TIGR02996 family)
MAKAQIDIWTKGHVKSLAPDEASIPAAEKVLKKGGFGTVEPTEDNRGWWVVCRGLTGTYQVTVRLETGEEGEAGEFDCRCNCPSYKNPCKHALALLLYLVDHPELRTQAEGPKAAATDFEGLLRAVFRDPDDDTPRLVFADYLEENDRPDRAALIRYQCEQARLKPQSARYKELAALIKPLVAKLRDQIGTLPEGMKFAFHRGFGRLDVNLYDFNDAGSLPARFTNLFRDGWIETIGTSIIYNLRESGVIPLLEHVGTFDVSRYGTSDELLLTVAAETAPARTTGRLARVKVHSSNRKAFDRLLRAQHGETIDLSADLGPERQYTNLNADLFARLAEFGRLSGARELYLHSGFALGAAELDMLRAADLSELRRLRLEYWELPRAAIERFVKSPALANLTALCLQGCSVRGPGVAAIVKSPLFARLHTLDLTVNPIGSAGAAALAGAKVPPKLKELVLAGCPLEPDDRKKLKRKYGTRLTL